MAVAVTGDLGLGDEIEKHRGAVWAWTLAFGLVLSLCFEVASSNARIKGDETVQQAQKTELDDLKIANQNLVDQNDSLLRLMEAYKSQAYSDLVDKLRLTLYAHVAMSRLNERETRVIKARIDSSRAPNSAPLDVKMFHRASAVINAGQSDGVMDGMQFEVVDDQTNQVYSVVTVSAVHEQASECAIEPDYDKVFWSDVINKLDSNSDGLVDLPHNKLSPLLPTSIAELDPEAAQQLIAVLDGALAANQNQYND